MSWLLSDEDKEDEEEEDEEEEDEGAEDEGADDEEELDALMITAKKRQEWRAKIDLLMSQPHDDDDELGSFSVPLPLNV